MRITTITLALAALLMAGCGGGSSEQARLTTQRVIAHVARNAGVGLVPSAPAGGLVILELPETLRGSFGGFEIYVTRTERADENLDEFLDRTDPDDRGIYWLRDQNAGWVAHTRHGSNVVLAWFGAPRRGNVTEEWRRLHGVMEGLV